MGCDACRAMHFAAYTDYAVFLHICISELDSLSRKSDHRFDRLIFCGPLVWPGLRDY